MKMKSNVYWNWHQAFNLSELIQHSESIIRFVEFYSMKELSQSEIVPLQISIEVRILHAKICFHNVKRGSSIDSVNSYAIQEKFLQHDSSIKVCVINIEGKS